MVLAWSSVEFQFNAEETPSFLMPACRVTPKTGTRRGFIAKTLLRLTRIHCRVIVLSAWTQNITSWKANRWWMEEDCTYYCEGQSSARKWANWRWFSQVLGFLADHSVNPPHRLSVYLHWWWKRFIAPQLRTINWWSNKWNGEISSEWRPGRLC